MKTNSNTVALSDSKIVDESTENVIGGYGISRDGTLNLDDEYFGLLYYDIEENPLKYEGQKISITGFVYRKSDFQENEIKIGRIQLPRCGSEDDRVVGLICKSEDSSDFNDDDWVNVKGILIVESYIDPITKLKVYDYYIEADSIDIVQRNSGLTIY